MQLGLATSKVSQQVDTGDRRSGLFLKSDTAGLMIEEPDIRAERCRGVFQNLSGKINDDRCLRRTSEIPFPFERCPCELGFGRRIGRAEPRTCRDELQSGEPGRVSGAGRRLRCLPYGSGWQAVCGRALYVDAIRRNLDAEFDARQIDGDRRLGR